MRSRVCDVRMSKPTHFSEAISSHATHKLDQHKFRNMRSCCCDARARFSTYASVVCFDSGWSAESVWPSLPYIILINYVCMIVSDNNADTRSSQINHSVRLWTVQQMRSIVYWSDSWHKQDELMRCHRNNAAIRAKACTKFPSNPNTANVTVLVSLALSSLIFCLVAVMIS